MEKFKLKKFRKNVDLMQEERAVAGHPASVVNNRWNVAGNREIIKKLNVKKTLYSLQKQKKSVCLLSLSGIKVETQTHSPLASSSQISKKTMRSYLA